MLGREEDAVDTFAALVMLEAQTTTMATGLAYAAQDWLVDAKASSQILDEQYAGVHSLSKQRAFNLVCMMLGKDFYTFESFARLVGYPENSLDNCSTRYDQARRTWIELLSPNINEAEPSRIVVSNMEALGEQPENIRMAQEWIIGNAILKEVGGMVSALFKIDMNLKIEAVYCSANGNPNDKGARNAYWWPDKSTIQYCYERGASHYDNALSLVQSERAKVQWLKISPPSK
jgi:hypothetical protein